MTDCHARFDELDPDRSLDQPHPDRLNSADPQFEQIMAAHCQAMADGRETYFDPVTGFVVITARTHALRGYCCERGCRHCPYRAH